MTSLVTTAGDAGFLDALSAGDSPLHRLDPRAKLVTTLAFAAVIASFPKTAVLPLLPFALFPVALAAAGGVPFGYLARRLLLILPFAILVGAFNPLLDRAPIPLGPFSVAGGWISFLSILLRFVLTVSGAIVLVALTGIHGLCGALEKIGVPRALVTQLLVLYRYLFVLLDEAGRMDRARALRSFGRRKQGISAAGPFLGTLLVRTWGRAERIHLAMLSRGFDGSFRFDRPLRFGLASALFTAGWLVLFALFRSVDVPLALGGFLVAGGR
ncbi:MAG TPA: cobalt ECF transporter T component CbiQ [Thermoanaerobaculia bacterium]